ncbi:MAG: ribose-5-phosphate isomerase RpiA [Methanomicrobiales archaeon]|nr:ribose-5-phosphate isomerase RpiA [Methanomicrobiales archaeon]
MENESIVKKKREAAFHAADMVEDGMVIGLGTGSTVSCVIHRLREFVEHGLHFTAVPTSFQTEILARRNGIRLVTLDEVEELDLAIDGADQVDRNGCMLKGRGGAHTREKCVASVAKRLVIVVTEEKLRESLNGSVPVEVIPFAYGSVRNVVQMMGGNAVLRESGGKDGPVISDNGNFILDCDLGVIDDPYRLEVSLDTIPGVAGNGIFSRYSKKTTLVVGKEKKIEVISF